MITRPIRALHPPLELRQLAHPAFHGLRRCFWSPVFSEPGPQRISRLRTLPGSAVVPGGSEPLALALALGAFWMFRRRRIFVAVWLGSLAVTVRRLIIFVLVGIGILYVLPLAIYFGDILLTVRRYLSRDYGAANATGPHGHLFGWPFHGIVVGTMIYPAPWTNLVLSFFRMFAVLAGTGMMFSARFRAYLKTYPQEAYFAAFISSRYFATTI